MNYSEQKGEESIPSSSSNIAKFNHRRSKITGMVGYAHSINTFHFIAASCQVVLGGVVVLLTTLGLVQPLWLSALLSMLGSITTMIGMYFLYTVVSGRKDSTRLLRDAMRRIMDAKN